MMPNKSWGMCEKSTRYLKIPPVFFTKLTSATPIQNRVPNVPGDKQEGQSTLREIERILWKASPQRLTVVCFRK